MTTSKPQAKPLLRGHIHQAMFFVSIGASSLLISKSHHPTERLGLIVYCLGLLAMFGVSALYHRITWNPKQRAFFRKLDHAAIYIMIAGSFTPLAYATLSADSQKSLLLTIWIVAFIGFIQCLFFVNIPKIVSALLYMLAGYTVLPYLSEMKLALGTEKIWWIAAGGIIYSIGGLFYGLKWPKISPNVFGYHELFHALVTIAAVIHFIVINSIVLAS